METWALAFSPGTGTEHLHFAQAGGTRGGVVIWEMKEQEETKMIAEMRLPPVGEHLRALVFS